MTTNHGPRKFSTANRRVHAGAPSPTILSGGEVPGNDAPIVGRIGGSSEYAALLDRELPKAAPAHAGMRVASFFCGCGGIDLGFRSAGIEVAFSSDYWKPAVATLERNLGHTSVVDDIRNVQSAAVPPVDVLTGGFPCVTFSTAGKRRGVVDDVAGKLYLELCRLIGEVRPRYFVAENVRGMLSANGGNAIKLVLAAFLRLGYRTSWELVNMADHGVPQTRERVIFVGVRLDQWRGTFRFPKATHRRAEDKKAPRWLLPAVSLRAAIGDLPDPDEQIVANTHQGGATYAALGRPPTEGYGYSRPTGPDEPGRSLATSPNNLLTVCNHGKNDAPVSAPHAMSKRLARGTKPAPTIVNEASNVQPFVDGVRRMTVRECARVQSFPDWYEFEGSQADGYRQVGNAVPPLYAKRLALAILEYDQRPVLKEV